MRPKSCPEKKKRAPASGMPSLIQAYRCGRRLTSFLFNTGFLTGEITKIEDSGTANSTMFVNFNLVDERTADGEDTFYTNAVGNLTDSKGLSRSTSTALQNNALEILDTLFVSFFNFIVDSDGIASLEFGELFTFDQILYILQ